MKKATATVLAFAIALGGCATPSKDVATAYVSPVQYNSYTCDQILAESSRLLVRVNELGGQLDKAADNDKVITGVALILFWPAAFALGGTKGQEAEYARLKGEHEALQQAWIQKKCSAPMAGVGPTPNGMPLAQGNIQMADTTPLMVGDRLTYRLREAMTGVEQGEATLTISSIANGQVGFDGDSLIISDQGTLTKGQVTRPTILGINVARLGTGNKFKGTFRSAPHTGNPDASVDLSVLGPDIYVVPGRRLSAVRIGLSGYSTVSSAQVPGRAASASPFNGSLVVDAATGIVLEMKVKSPSSLYAIDLALVRIENPNPPPAALPATTSAPPAPGANTAATKEEKLKELKRLHDAGLITPEVYSAQQKVILGN
ncbi:MAG: SHOCT domain-containing protein [Burkholderiaceae bacterium]|nr:SHOCT domain-containing protein [Burkholderiaceae bacterium]